MPSFVIDRVRSRMSEFQLAERDAVMLVAHSVHKNHMPILQKFLEERDPDRCGLVTFAVLVQGMRFCGVGVKDMDDISGAVCYTDFLSDVVQFQKNMQESALWFAFSTFDIKCTGEADRRALQKELCDDRSYLYECFRVNFPSLAPEAVLPLLEQAPSSRISFEELMGILQRLSPDSVDLKEKLPF
ncbi:Calcium-dependent protein kinase 6 [Symbiodinium microadriaticum]|uniref:Calcium-dependent protein kinase 6 n=1 Tax=Symbiodinium microadriaticum TaxID=2951 RepID=A0A1Q9C863_SYMMI|nr:Calcium-dependent protein kinase 6 [Symbiodinium microadriaticum]